jgi:serine/threonine protein kinase
MFYVMKLVRGAPLDRAAADLPLGDRLRLFGRACEAVGFAHAHGIVHRDLKPANIMVGSHGEVLVVDWGLARLLESTPADPDVSASTPHLEPGASNPSALASSPRAQPSVRTAHGQILGTPGFMAPEQARGAAPHVDQRSDVYALGAVLESLLGPRADAAPAPLRSIVARAKAEDPATRYADASQMADELVRFTSGMAVHAHAENLLERTRRVAARHKVPILLVIAYLVMRILLVVFTR